MNIKNILDNEQGMALITIVIISLVIATMVFAVHYGSTIYVKIAGNKRTAVQNYYSVEGNNTLMTMACTLTPVTDLTRAAVIDQNSNYYCRYNFNILSVRPGYSVGTTSEFHFTTTTFRNNTAIANESFIFGPAPSP